MFVQVRMVDENGELKGRAYTYACTYEGVRVGSRVIAEFGRNENQELEIVAVDCAEPDFACKHIKKVVADSELEGQMSFAMSAPVPQNEPRGIESVVASVSIDSLDKMAMLDSVNATDVIDELREFLQPADKIVVTEDNCKDVKAIVSGTYSKTIKLFDEARKQPTRAFKAKVDKYNKEMLKVIEYLTAEQAILKDKTNAFDEMTRDANVKIAEDEIRQQIETLKLEPLFAEQLTIKDEYKKLNVSKKSIVTDIQNQAMMLSMKQSNYHTKLAMAKTIVDMQNETLTNKISFEKYTDLILQNVLQMGSDSEITDKIMADANSIREMEKRVEAEKAAEIERQKQAEARRLEEERARIEAEKARIEAEKAKIKQDKADISSQKADIDAQKADIQAQKADIEENVNEADTHAPAGEFVPDELFFVPKNEIFSATYRIDGTMSQFHALVQYANSMGMTMEKIG